MTGRLITLGAGHPGSGLRANLYGAELVAAGGKTWQGIQKAGGCFSQAARSPHYLGSMASWHRIRNSLPMLTHRERRWAGTRQGGLLGSAARASGAGLHRFDGDAAVASLFTTTQRHLMEITAVRRLSRGRVGRDAAALAHVSAKPLFHEPPRSGVPLATTFRRVLTRAMLVWAL